MAVSSLISSPFYPLGGSTAFFISYPRPMKYWERHYKTNRLDDTNTKLGSSIEGNAAALTLNNLNSIFYQHVENSLRATLYDDLVLGRWGDVKAGDVFIIANDKFTALIHIIQFGNGFVTFQLRGLEFKGTYCQERELEVIHENPAGSNTGFFFLKNFPRLPHFLSVNAACGLRWNSWEVVSTDYVLQTYSIAMNPANTFFFVYSLRLAAIRYFIMSAMYFALSHAKLPTWLETPDIQAALAKMGPDHVDLDRAFNRNTDVDYDERLDGVSLAKFISVFGEWIEICLQKRVTLFPK